MTQICHSALEHQLDQNCSCTDTENQSHQLQRCVTRCLQGGFRTSPLTWQRLMKLVHGDSVILGQIFGKLP